MKITEFVLIETKGKSALDWEYFADVSVTTGMLWWKKTERRKICRPYGCKWYFMDTGKFTPGYEVEDLERAYKARTSLYA